MKNRIATQVFFFFFFLVTAYAAYGQSKKYVYKSEEPFNTRIPGPEEDEMQVWFIVPIEEQADSLFLRKIFGKVLQRITGGTLKCYSSTFLKNQLSFYSYTSDFEEGLRQKCKEIYDVRTPSVCDSALEKYYGRVFWGYYTRNLKTGKIRFGKELGFVAFSGPYFPTLKVFSVDLKDIQDLTIKPGLKFNSWFSKLNYFHVPINIGLKKSGAWICDSKDKETLTELAEILKGRSYFSADSMVDAFRDCKFESQRPDLYKY